MSMELVGTHWRPMILYLQDLQNGTIHSFP
jgi:hypothetical protein